MNRKFEDYLNEQIELIAQGSPTVDPDFEPKLKVYLAMIKTGIAPDTAKQVMTTLYM